MGPLGLSSLSLGLSIFGGLRPTFSLDFLGGTLDSRVTFTRASKATRTNRSGLLEEVAINVPRFDYDPVTLACNGLLIEEARTNLSTNSRQFVTGASVGMVQNLPGADGVAFTAYTMTESATTAQQFAATTPNPSFTSGTTYALTALVKPGSANKCQLTGSGTCFGTTQCVNFSLSGAGSVLQALGGAVGTIKPGPNGFYVCSITVAAITTGTGTAVAVAFITSDTDARLPNITGTSRTLILDHHQAEVGAFPTSIIPTSGAAATRAADVATVSSVTWFNQNEGTFMAEGDHTWVTGSANKLWHMDDGSASNRIYSDATAASSRSGNVDVGGATQAAIVSAYSGANGVPHRHCLAYKANQFNASANGVAGTPDTTGSVPTALSTLRLGNSVSGSAASCLNGHIRRIDYYNSALSAAQVTALTV